MKNEEEKIESGERIWNELIDSLINIFPEKERQFSIMRIILRKYVVLDKRLDDEDIEILKRL